MAKTKTSSKRNKKKPSERTLIKYRLMIDEWFKNEFDGAKAYKKYHPKASQQTAEVNFSRIKDIPEVADYIEKLKSEIAERNKITIDECVEMLTAMARFDIADLLNPDGSIKDLYQIPKYARMVIEGIDVDEIKVEDTVMGFSKKIKLSNRRANIIELMKYLGGYKNDNEQKNTLLIENQVSIDYSKLSTSTLKELDEATENNRQEQDKV